MAQQSLDFGTAAANDGEYIRTAFPKIEANFDELYNAVTGLVNTVCAIGQSGTLIPDDSSASAKTANTAAIQAAIDYAYANELQVITISAGVFYCNPGIYLDAPGNLRSTPSAPTIFSFSLHLTGIGGGTSDATSHGTELHFTDNTSPALIVGTGQGMRVSNIAIVGPSGASSRAALSANGIGIALAGGDGGLSVCTFEHVTVHNFRRNVVTGYNSDSLCDSVTLFKCHIGHGYVGLHVSQTQNYIISLIDCTFHDNTTGVYSPVGKSVRVRGGNYSVTDADRNAFTIGSTSVLSSLSDSFAGGTFTNWSFTTTLSADDQPMIDGSYDAFVINTTGFGLVPLVLTNYNASTKVATFKFYVGWLTSHYKSVNIKDDTDITTELQAATTLYACETVTPFYGTGIDVDGAHLENPGVLTRLISTQGTFTGDRVSRISKTFFNYNINHADLAAGTNAQKAAFYCQQVFPFIRQVQAGVECANLRLLSDDTYVGRGKDGVNIEVIGNTTNYRLISRNSDFFHPNITTPLHGDVGDATLQPSMSHGAGEWDSTPFLPSSGTAFYVPPNLNSAPFLGWRPAPWTTPRLSLVQLADIEDGLGAVGTYPPLCGESVYSVLYEGASGPTATLMVRSAHQFFSWGQDLTINWEYKGQTNILRLSSLTAMFAGLRITLDNGGGDQSYTVTGVYPTRGYVTVNSLLAGTKTTTYNGATVKQPVYSISRTGNLPISKFTTNTTAGATTAAVGDLTGAHSVNLKVTAVGAANYSTRTAAEMFGDIAGCYAGFHYMLSIQNTNAGTTTLNPGTNVTINGTATIAQNTARLFHVTFPTATTCTINSLGVTATL